MHRAIEIITLETLLLMNTFSDELKTEPHRAARTLPELPHREVILTRPCNFVLHSSSQALNRKPRGVGRNTTAPPRRAGSRPDQPVHPSRLNDAMRSTRANITRLTEELVNKGPAR